MFWIVRLSGSCGRVSDSVKLSRSLKKKKKETLSRRDIITLEDKNMFKDLNNNLPDNGQVTYHSILTYILIYISLYIALDSAVFSGWWL